MGLLDRFRKEKETKIVTDEANVATDLEQLCANDSETFATLIHTMFLDPRKIKMSTKEAIENAKKFEKANDLIRARAMYEVAGGLAIYEGNVKKVVEYFSEAERISPKVKYPIIRNPEMAVAKAKEYYDKHLKA